MKHIKNNKGQSLVEFTMILPLVLLILMGILTFGIMLNTYLTLSHISKEGARMGALGESDADIIAKMIDISPALDHTRLDIEINPVQGSRSSGDTVTVSSEYQFQVIVPIISNIVGDVVSLEAQTSMRVE